MNYVKQNDTILNKWEISNRQHGEVNFAADGILNKGKLLSFDWGTYREESGTENNLWANSPLRILFLTKDQNTGGGEAWDSRTVTGRMRLDTDTIPSAFYRMMMYLLYGLVHTNCQSACDYTFSNADAIHLFDNYPLAHVNVKKEAGGSSVSNDLLRFYLERDREFIREQILNLDADLIVCCGYSDQIEESGNLLLNFLNNNGYSFEQFSSRGWVYYDASQNKVAINTYHLSARKSSENIFTEIMADYQAFLCTYPQFLKKSL